MYQQFNKPHYKLIFPQLKSFLYHCCLIIAVVWLQTVQRYISLYFMFIFLFIVASGITVWMLITISY